MSTELEQIEQELARPGLSEERRTALKERRRRLRASEPATQAFSVIDDETTQQVAPVAVGTASTGDTSGGQYHGQHQHHHGDGDSGTTYHSHNSHGGYDGGAHYSSGHDSGGYSGGHDSGGYADSGSYGG